ncbi:MAG: BlaI/MecI/CopY family transcriptional regulator [Saprospiraceae bacterium]
MKRLTQGEEEVMQAVWDLGKGSAGDVREVLAKAGSVAKPTTISTVLRILVDKGFLKFEAFGRTYVYQPAVAKTDYSANRLSSFIERFFGGNPAKLVSFLAERENLSLTDIESMLDADSDDQKPAV